VGAFYDALGPMSEPASREDVVREPLAQAVRPEWISDDFAARMQQVARLPTQAEARERFSKVEHTIWRPSLGRWRDQTLADIDARGIASRTLIVWGYQDRSASWHQGMRLYERIAARSPQVSMLVLNQAGHYVFRDRPSEFDGALLHHCRGAKPASDG
jgi:pimeloyl-ACP methyl ester carboxylesterase